MAKPNPKSQRALRQSTATLLVCTSLFGCAHVGGGIGLSIPIGPFGSLGVNVGSDGRVGGSVGVGYGPASVQIGTSVNLPPAQTTQESKK